MIIQVRHYDKTWPRLPLALKVCEHVLKEGKGAARKFVAPNGLSIGYDRMWFTGSTSEDGHRLIGNEWEIEMFFHKATTLHPDNLPDQPRRCRFFMEEMWFLRANVTNVEGFEKDMTLLRMFGPEELFSG